jgi:hypothetical protein
MSEVHDTDSTDDGESQEDSPIIKELRSQLRATQKEAEKLRALQAEEEAKAQSARATSATEIVNALGMEGLSEDVLNWVEGEITQEKVIGALQARNIPLPDGTAQPEPTTDEETVNPSRIGQQVASAAAGGAVKSVEERLAEATSQEEIRAIMEEAELTHDHF